MFNQIVFTHQFPISFNRVRVAVKSEFLAGATGGSFRNSLS